MLSTLKPLKRSNTAEKNRRGSVGGDSARSSKRSKKSSDRDRKSHIGEEVQKLHKFLSFAIKGKDSSKDNFSEPGVGEYLNTLVNHTYMLNKQTTEFMQEESFELQDMHLI